MEQSKENPDVLLSPHSMALKCIAKIADHRQIFYEYRKLDELVTDSMRDQITYAMKRQENLGIPIFREDFAMRLVKLNQIDYNMWETEFIQRVFKMVEDIEIESGAGEDEEEYSDRFTTDDASSSRRIEKRSLEFMKHKENR